MDIGPGHDLRIQEASECGGREVCAAKVRFDGLLESSTLGGWIGRSLAWRQVSFCPTVAVAAATEREETFRSFVSGAKVGIEGDGFDGFGKGLAGLLQLVGKLVSLLLELLLALAPVGLAGVPPLLDGRAFLLRLRHLPS